MPPRRPTIVAPAARTAVRCARWLALVAAVLVSTWHVAALAQPVPGKRIALVVGNARYPTLPLDNPENDARAVSATLRGLGYEVAEHLNLGVREFRRVMRDFARRAGEEEGVVVFYFAGHGVQIDGRNYLLPVDLNLRDEEEVKDESVDIDDLFMSRLERARAQVRIVILDACRDNPFRGRTRNIRVGGGLAEMGARGSLIAYASAPGAAAEDGPPGTNSIYTKHLVNEMRVEGLEVEQMFKNVRVKVLQDTNQRQVPWTNSSLTVNFSFSPFRDGRPAIALPAQQQEQLEELARQRQKLDADLKRLEDREREQKQREAELRRLATELEQGRAGQPPKAVNRVEDDRERRAREEQAKLLDRLQREEQAIAEERRRLAQERDRARKTEETAVVTTTARPVQVQPVQGMVPAPAARPNRAVLCSDLLRKQSLGEPLTSEERAMQKAECMR